MTEATPPTPAPYQSQDPAAAPPVPGQYPPAPGQYPPAGTPYGQFPPAPVKKSGGAARSIVIRVLAVLIVIGVISLGTWIYKQATGNPDEAKVGSCMAGVTADTLKVTDCTKSDAKWSVVGKVTTDSDPSETAASSDCDPFPTATVDFYKGNDNGGYVLCLAPKS